MNTPRASNIVTWFCAVPALAGAVTLVGWALGDARLKGILPGLIAMNPLTAICFVLAATSLWLRSRTHDSPGRRRFAIGLALLIAAVGGSKLGSYVYGFEFPVDRWLFANSLGENRMAPNTALCFFLSGLAIASLDRVSARGFWPAQWLSFAVATVALVSLVGYGYGATSLYRMASYIPIALNTAVAFGMLSLGILLARPERGVVAVVLDSGPGGIMARRLLPAVVLIPCGLGWLRILGQRMDFYETEFGAALMVAVTVMLFVGAVGWIAAALNRSDVDRRQAEAEVRRMNEVLEHRVTNRTAALAAANADLLQKNQENEMFVYSVSHDLRSPLVNLQGFSQELALIAKSIRELLVGGNLPSELEARGVRLIDEDMHRGIHYIQTAVSRLSGIIDALLRLSRAGRVEYQHQAIDMQALVTRIVESAAGTMFDRGVKVEVAELPAAWGDPIAIEQVFANLIGNAVNYLDANRAGRIEVGCVSAGSTREAANASTTFYVKDNGLGIEEAYRSKVFQALKRLHPEVAKGEGIGLAIVKRIVDRHGGEVWFESTAGAGATFFVKLPHACEITAPAAAIASSKQKGSTDDDMRTARNLVGGRR